MKINLSMKYISNCLFL